MANNRTDEEGKIDIEEIKKSILSSGYLIEQRVEPIITKKGYYVEMNDVYQDDETGKSREIDLTAISAKFLSEDKSHRLFPYLIIECENNHQPVVFFRSYAPLSFLHYKESKLSGIPIHVFPKNENRPLSLNEYLIFDDFHHYCKGVFSTQYCSFQQINKSNIKKWIALHPDSQHDSMENIVKCVKFKIKDHFNSYTEPAQGETELTNIQIYYPLIILQGDMYEAFIEKGELTLKSQDHIQFRKQTVKNGQLETFQVDVIKETYLKKYLALIEKETDEIVDRLKAERELIDRSAEIIAGKIRSEPDKSKHYKILNP